ncbi:hypothetical protein [Isoptericola hypogeus]
MNQQPDAVELERVPGEDEPLDAADVALLARLARTVSALDPVPDGLVERSLFAVTLAGLEAEVAEVMELQRVLVPAGSVRGGDTLEARTITFTHERLTVMIALSPADDGRSVRIDGWVAPAAELVVQLRQPDGNREATTDADGRFVFDGVDGGPSSLLVRLPADGPGEGDAPEGTVVTTPVIEI